MKAYIFLANGFEEIEALTVADVLRRAQMETLLVSMEDGLSVTGSHDICVRCDTAFRDVESMDLCPDGERLLILPGGMPGTMRLLEHEQLKTMLRTAYEKGAHVSAICAAPRVLHKAGLLTDKTVCCHPSVEEYMTQCTVSRRPVCTDGAVTTSRGMGTALDFALELARLFCGDECVRTLKKAICSPEC